MTAQRKKRKMTTDEALESLLGKKAAKRLRRIAKEVAKSDQAPTKKSSKKKNPEKKKGR